MASHTGINGREIEYDASEADAAFLARLGKALADPEVTEADMRALVFADESPLFDQDAGYTFTVSSALDSPLMRVVLDFLDQKRVACGSLDLERVAKRYTMTVADAAQRLGLGESALRSAVLSERIPSWKRHGQIWLSPEGVASYKVSPRGRPPRLTIVMGSEPGASMKIRVSGGTFIETKRVGAVIEGYVSQWDQAAVLTGKKQNDKTTYRYYLLAPGGAAQLVAMDPFRVEGRFTVRERLADKKACETFAALKTAWSSAT